MSGIENVPLQNKSSALSCSELWMSGTFVKSFHSQILCVLQIWPSVTMHMWEVMQCGGDSIDS